MLLLQTAVLLPPWSSFGHLEVLGSQPERPPSPISRPDTATSGRKVANGRTAANGPPPQLQLQLQQYRPPPLAEYKPNWTMVRSQVKLRPVGLPTAGYIAINQRPVVKMLNSFFVQQRLFLLKVRWPLNCYRYFLGSKLFFFTEKKRQYTKELCSNISK